MTILLTAFEPFGAIEVNPSQVIAQIIYERLKMSGNESVMVEILPTVYRAAESKMRDLIRIHRPAAVLSLGVARARSAIALERVALNIDDTDRVDNSGDAPTGRLIVSDGPVAYWSTLPLELMRQALMSREIPVKISNHAGSYVCNHVFYTARDEIEKLGIATVAGFVHLPLMTEQVEEGEQDDTPSLALETMLEAVNVCLQTISLEAGQAVPG